MLLNIGKDTAGDLSKESIEKWSLLQKKYRLEDAQTEPMISLVANENYVEFTLRYIVNYKRRRLAITELFTKILNQIEASNGEIQFTTATLQLVDSPEFNVNIKK